MPEEIGDVIGLPDGRILNTHGSDECSGPHCCIHNPSSHPLKDAPLSWRSDRALMERICKHGVAHPDPDDAAHWERQVGGENADEAARRVLKFRQEHPCDGCCVGFDPSKLVSEQMLDKADLWLQASWFATDPSQGPWPNDPDGGELRIFNALHNVLKLAHRAEENGRLTISLFQILEAVGRGFNGPPKDSEEAS